MAHEHNADWIQDRHNLKLCLIFNAVFFVVELLGGIWTNSLALISDAGHMFSDVGALGFSLIAVIWSVKPPTPEKTYGYHRLEILAALVNGLILWGVTAWIFIEAFQRLQAPPMVKSYPMLIIAIAGLMVNFISAWLLYPSQRRSINLRSAFLHLAADAVGSLAAIGASLAMLWKGWYWFDPLVSFFIGLLIIGASWQLIQEAASILMESTPPHLDIKKVLQGLEQVPGVINIHDLHIWTITSGLYALSVHVVVNGSRDRETLRCEMMQLLQDKFGLEHTTIQLEEEASACPNFCSLRQFSSGSYQ
jgi:cobalt-zinc-cadmium efflux system protein